MPKYLDPQAKLLYDLKKELHILSHQNRHLRTTIIEAPTWELHALSHTSATAIKAETADDKALLAMHNEILKTNTTYNFHPRGAGRVYPVPAAGRKVPFKPAKKYYNEGEYLQSGSYLENASMVTSTGNHKGLADPRDASLSKLG